MRPVQRLGSRSSNKSRRSSSIPAFPAALWQPSKCIPAALPQSLQQGLLPHHSLPSTLGPSQNTEHHKRQLVWTAAAASGSSLPRRWCRRARRANALAPASAFSAAGLQGSTEPSSILGENEPPEDLTRDFEAEMEELLKLIGLLPPPVRAEVEAHPQMPELLEVVMDLGRSPIARFPNGDVKLSEQPITSEDIEFAIQKVGTFGGDNRAGIDRTLHRISCIRNRAGRIIGLTCRAGRAIKGSARMVADIVRSGASILFLGRPGVGKTTAIREVSRALSDDLHKRVIIVDTSNEIGGDGDIPHVGIGRARRMQVPDPELQHRVMIEAVENHMPEVVVIDEIGTEAECAAARTIAQRGVMLVATAHGNELENVMKNPALADLVGGIQSVTLGDEEARKRGVQKSILERGGPPSFDVAIEMLARSKWRVHLDVGQAVDMVLAGGQAAGQVRERTPEGDILSYTQAPVVSQLLAPKRPSLGGSARPMPTPPNNGTTNTSIGTSSSNSSSNGTSSSSSSGSSSNGGGRLSAGAGGLGSRGVAAACAIGPSSLICFLHLQFFCRRLFPYQLDSKLLWDVMASMDALEKVMIVRRVSEADAVLGLRSSVKADAALRKVAKECQIPIYAIKGGNVPSLTRAFRTLLGVDPSAGGSFVQRSASRSGQASPHTPSVAPGSSLGSGYRALSESEALEEARLACEDIVSPLQQQAELLPRAPHVIQEQINLVSRYKLGWEVVGEPGSQDQRLKVLPTP
ncbi:single-stranded nucleic acid-binding R3H domain-containing protein [Dunaliella salina]|uniref:Single-stranded nucleic acid-binding R3H domain-containing protein n=2 Tax=Dunaliella salina TaxID=3046 RepID=A0ABQ7G600_DUNSA|nr:single-stranded nucleic acid-binding R3H domain-containing protein [Dunaliella salina]|eukprot:KAF5830043.1 single-stranded nucleic acid-binding R3H domain-containing protein [Dunaliella salina]